MSEGLDQDPRKVFVNFLLSKINDIETQIYEGPPTGAIRPMRGLIASLDNKSKKKLKKQRETLSHWENDVRFCSRQKIEELYDEIMTYLHKTYLKEVSFARPQYRTRKKLGLPK